MLNVTGIRTDTMKNCTLTGDCSKEKPHVTKGLKGDLLETKVPMDKQ